MIELYHGDCLEIMEELIEQGIKVDAVITDPPYGTTACKWDSVIPFEMMWFRINNLTKENSPVVLFGNEPFSSALRMSNIKEYKYDWIWEKNIAANFMMAKHAPLKKTENIIVFSKAGINTNSKVFMKYFPQNLEIINKNVNSRYVKNQGIYRYNSLNKSYVQSYTKYPHNILIFAKDNGFHYHPTQKPIALMEYLVKTYTNECDTVLDFTMGSGTTGVACKNLNRNFIGIELDKTYFEIAKQRIEQAGNLLF